MLKKKKKKSAKPRDPDYRSIAKKIVPVSSLPPEIKVVLYGKPGTGKTTLAASFPKPVLIIDVGEKGTDSVRKMKNVKVMRAENWDEIDMLYWYLRKEKHGFKTVVFDTMSQSQDMAIRKVLEERGKAVDDNEVVGGWGTMRKQDWGSVATLMKELFLGLKELPLNVVLIAHDRTFAGSDDDDEEGAIEPSVGPRLMPSVASTINAAVGVIGNTFIRERFKKTKIGKKVKEKREVKYCLRIGPHAYYVTKIRKPKEIVPPAVIEEPTFEKILELIDGDADD